MKSSISVLFIGNSYTYYNEMPETIFAKMAEKSGYDITVEKVTKGGARLVRYLDPNDEYGERVFALLCEPKRFDYVVLQEQSLLPASEEVELFFDSVRKLADKIRAVDAKPILYATWGRKPGSHNLSELGLTNETMTNKLAESYQKMGDELCIPVAHVGRAFYDVLTSDSELELYNEDKSHPSYVGSYLAAATIFSRIFGERPPVVADESLLTKEKASALTDAAMKTNNIKIK